MDYHQPGDKQRRSQTTEEALTKANWIVSQTIIQPWSIITKIRYFHGVGRWCRWYAEVVSWWGMCYGFSTFSIQKTIIHWFWVNKVPTKQNHFKYKTFIFIIWSSLVGTVYTVSSLHSLDLCKNPVLPRSLKKIGKRNKPIDIL